MTAFSLLSKATLLLSFSVGFLSMSQPLRAANIYQDQFNGSTIPAQWNNSAGSPVILDDPNDQLDYAHEAGTTRRFLNFNDLLTGQTAYLKAEISNFTGSPSIWFGFVGNNAANNSHYAQTRISANATYELFLNNTTSAQPFDNGAGWSGSLPAGAGIYSINGTSTAGNLTLGSNFPPVGSNIRGFGFANFGNASVFPTSSFSIDSISVDDSLIIATTPNDSPPTVAITSPANATTVVTGNATTFTATANDSKDGDVSANLTWTSNLSGLLGTGPTISVPNLAVGTHTITATTSDNENLTGSSTISITVHASPGKPGALRPNIIVIISDDAGYADFGFMNAHSGSTSDVPTPNLDALAARGITFSRAYVAANCQPTRAAIVTGAYQARIGNENVGNNNFRDDQLFEGLPVETDTIWDRMRKLGYTTGAIGKWHLGSIENTPSQLGNRPENQGIDRFFGFWHGSREFTAGHYNDQSTNPDHPNQLRYLREAIIHPDDSKTDVIKEYTDYANVSTAEKDLTKILGDYAEQFVADHHDDPKPFFLYLAHPAPHKPWTNNSPDYNDPRIKNLTPNNRRQVASMMITMDKEIGDLMAKLDDPNGDGDKADSITDNTLVIFLNDNGGVAGMENGVNGTSNGILNGFKGSAHDGGIRVPMIMAGAGIDPSKIGTVFDKPVHGIDLLPTSVALAGGTIDPSEKIDGINLLPHLNGQNTALPHDTLVHRWRGTFAVIQDNWKLVNTRNTNAAPSFYKLHNLNTDPGEANDISGANATRVESMTREVTHMEAKWDKPRYPILNRTLDTEPLNIIDHFTFRPGLHNDWSAGAPEQSSSSSSPQNWFEGGTTNPENLLRSDGFSGAILEFPAHSSDYISNNDLRRKTGLEFMLNKIILSGNDTSDKTANLTGLPLIFTDNLAEKPATIEINSTGNFTCDLNLDLILYHNLNITGDGTTSLQIDGDISQFFEKRGLKKTGTSKAEINGARTYSGDTDILGGTLKIAQINPADEDATYRIANDATLNLTFEGTDTINKLFIEGIQQPAGIYSSEIAQITGTGTLTVQSGPGGFTAWAEQNAPGALFTGDHDSDNVPNALEYFLGETGSTFTRLPKPQNGSVTWPISPGYLGTFDIEVSSNLSIWNPADPANVSLTPGSSLQYSFPQTEPNHFIRLAVVPE